MTDGSMPVAARVAAIIADMPAIGKDGTADPRQGGYKYRGIEQITGHVQPLLARHGVVIVPQVQSIDVRDITVAGKPWTDTTVTVRYLICGADGDQLEAITVGIGRDNSDKGANKAMTQAFKYLLLQLLAVSDSADDVEGVTHEAEHHQRPVDRVHERVQSVTDRLTALNAEQRQAFTEYRGERSASPSALAGDPEWLTRVEQWLDTVSAT